MLTDRERKVLTLIDENKEETIEYLRKLLGFKTVTPADGKKAESGDYRKLQDFIYKTLGEMDFELDRWEIDTSQLEKFTEPGDKLNRDLGGMPVVVGMLKGGGAGKSLILNGHYDVVPSGILTNWKHDPFGGEIENNKVFGRGACDMKGGIAAMLQAVRYIQQAGIPLKGDVIVEIVPDEESSGIGTLACCEKGFKADAAIIPEPTNMNVLVAMRGGLSGKITVFGRAGHADMSQPHWSEGGAVNAISKAVKIIQALEELTDEWRNRADKQHKFLDPDMIMPTVIRGGDWPVTYPEKVDIVFLADCIPMTSEANLRKEIEEKITSVANTDPWMKEHPPKLEAQWYHGIEIDENEAIVKTCMEAVRELGIESKPAGMGSIVDPFVKTATLPFLRG
ncbi:MAG: ArgE/DapE family deacylase [Deltaproteobacteria bacterium]|nr:ArgE/DapE family deacylase [Deltaproteobacteria bacterium]